MARPAWAKVALKFGWITCGQFYAIERFDTGKRHPDIGVFMYEESPMFRLLKKEPLTGVRLVRTPEA